MIPTLVTRPLVVLALAVICLSACKEDPVTGGDPIDPTLAVAPCDSPQTSMVGTNGFVLSGSGYNGEVVRIGGASSSTEFVFHDSGGVSILMRVEGTISLPDARDVPAIIDLTIPGYVPGAYALNTLAGDSASAVRMEFRKSYRTLVYTSLSGRITLDSLVNNALPYGRFCGTFTDSATNSRVAVMSGVFSPA